MGYQEERIPRARRQGPKQPRSPRDPAHCEHRWANNACVKCGARRMQPAPAREEPQPDTLSSMLRAYPGVMSFGLRFELTPDQARTYEERGPYGLLDAIELREIAE